MMTVLRQKFRDLRELQRRDTVRERPVLIAGRIMQAAQEIVSHIEGAFDKRRRPEAPLFVMLGENHTRAAHKIAHMLVLRLLKERGYKIAVGLEDPYSLAHTALAVIRQRAPLDVRGQYLEAVLATMPRDDPRHLLAAGMLMKKEDASLTSEICRNINIRAGVSMAFNDAARTQQNFGNHLDPDDFILRSEAARGGILLGAAPVLAFEPQGVHLRNRVMVERAADHAGLTQPDIYIQRCGNYHVAGMPALSVEALPYGQSLSALHQASGHNVLGLHVFLAAASQASCPADGRLPVARGPVLKGPAFTGFCNPAERAWLAAVLPQLMPEAAFKKVLSDPAFILHNNIG